MTLERFNQLVAILGRNNAVAAMDTMIRELASVMETTYGGDPVWGPVAIQIATELREAAGKLPSV